LHGTTPTSIIIHNKKPAFTTKTASIINKDSRVKNLAFLSIHNAIITIYFTIPVFTSSLHHIMKPTQLLLHRDYAAALSSVLLSDSDSTSDTSHVDGPRRQRHLDEYYAYTEDDKPNNQHPIMTAVLLLILGTLVIASVVVFIIRLYRKVVKTSTDDEGDDSTSTKMITVEMEEQRSSAASGQQDPPPPVWANPAAAAAAADAYVHM
jgi:hypothetical protein